jgi:DNA-directed RNA polymerase I, II, and III subunit RPABC2
MADNEDYGADDGEFDDYDGEDLIDDGVEDDADVAAIAAAAAERQAFKKLYIAHPECVLDYVEETIKKLPLKVAPPRRMTVLDNAALALASKTDDQENTATNIDKNHTTYPYLTKYEATRIIGFRANQLSQGVQPFINVPDHVSDVREIARLELAAGRLPFILKRPLPDGSYEYWRLQDLLQI